MTRLVGGSPSEREAHEERCAAIDRVTEDLRTHYRDGSSEIRVVIGDVAEELWQEIEAPIARRFPAGDVKVEYLSDGLVVEWVRRVPEMRETQTLDYKRRIAEDGIRKERLRRDL